MAIRYVRTYQPVLSWNPPPPVLVPVPVPVSPFMGSFDSAAKPAAAAKTVPTSTTLPALSHKAFNLLLALASGLERDDRNVWITGPAGSGKTTGARQLSEYLNVPFEFNGAIDSEYKLSGFIDAQGRVVSTAFRRAWEGGGVYLFDECDASMPGALLAFNAALANGHASFPDGATGRHPDCYVLAAANTWGFGGTSNYVGRAKMDGAFLDRFVSLEWGYDEDLERHLAQSDEWVTVVQTVRAAAKAAGAQIVVSPRASIKGAQLLRSGLAYRAVVSATFGRYFDHPAWATVGAAATYYAEGN